MVDLDSLIVCAVGHADLPVVAIRRDGAGACSQCGRRYACDQGTYDMAPVPRPNWIAQKRVGHVAAYAGAVARMKLPLGAVDCSHFEHLAWAAGSEWLAALRLQVARQANNPASDRCFVPARGHR